MLMLVVYLVSFYFVTSKDSNCENVETGSLYSFYSDKDYICELTDYCVKNKYLYLLYGSKGVLKVYSINGEYIKSFAYQKLKGQSALYTDEKYVYLYDESLNYYILEDGEFYRFIKYSDYTSYLQQLNNYNSKDQQRKVGDRYYLVKNGSIYCYKHNDNVQLIVNRPMISLLFCSITPIIIVALCVLAVIILTKVYKWAAVKN